jgi:hypothetical protein
MALPSNLLDVWEETAVVGDVDAFMDYLESGQAAQDYNERMATRLRELDETLPAPSLQNP